MKRIVSRFLEAPVLWSIAICSVGIPFLLTSRYYQDIAVMTFLWAGLVCSWNLYSGYCKRISIGHAAFFGVGAYTSTLLYLTFGVSPWLGMLAGGLVSAALALLIGGVTLRLRGTFFVLSTIAFAKIMEVFMITSKDLTGGSLGLYIPYEPAVVNMIFTSKVSYAILMWAYMILVLFLCVRLEKSRLGYSLIAVGQNQESAESLGINPAKTMLTAFTASAVLTSFGGTLFAQYVMFMEPSEVMGMGTSINFILLAIAGGMGRAFGPMIGAFILMPVSILLRGWFAGVSGLHNFILGLILIVILLYRPDGILPQIQEFCRKMVQRLRQGNPNNPHNPDNPDNQGEVADS